ncbi:hypothetical protein ACU635_04300 [[Actinomadura] parvosata]
MKPLTLMLMLLTPLPPLPTLMPQSTLTQLLLVSTPLMARLSNRTGGWG